MSSTTLRRRPLARAAAALGTAALTALGLVTALPAHAADADYQTTATVTAASADAGITLELAGTGYTDLPAATGGGPAQGIMVLLRDKIAQDDAYVNANGRSLGSQLKMLSNDDIVDGAWSATLTVPPATLATLSPDGSYEVVAWTTHSMLNADTFIDSVAVEFTADQLALLGAATGAEETDETEEAEATEETTEESPAETTTVEPVVECRMETVPAKAGTPQLTWGIKSSFVQYVEGAGGGSITTSNGAARAAQRFTFGNGSGQLAANGSGTVSFPGAVNLTAHGGAMDLTISGINITVNADRTGSLTATVNSKDMQGNDVTLGGNAVASLQFSQLDEKGGVATVTLTEAGASAFAGFYSAGEQLDSLTLAIVGAQGATQVERCYDADGNLVNKDGSPLAGAGLAATGVATGSLVALGGGTALLGGLVLLMARRRTAADHR